VIIRIVDIVECMSVSELLSGLLKVKDT